MHRCLQTDRWIQHLLATGGKRGREKYYHPGFFTSYELGLSDQVLHFIISIADSEENQWWQSYLAYLLLIMWKSRNEFLFQDQDRELIKILNMVWSVNGLDLWIIENSGNWNLELSYTASLRVNKSLSIGNLHNQVSLKLTLIVLSVKTMQIQDILFITVWKDSSG